MSPAPEPGASLIEQAFRKLDPHRPDPDKGLPTSSLMPDMCRRLMTMKRREAAPFAHASLQRTSRKNAQNQLRKLDSAALQFIELIEALNKPVWESMSEDCRSQTRLFKYQMALFREQLAVLNVSSAKSIQVSHRPENLFATDLAAGTAATFYLYTGTIPTITTRLVDGTAGTPSGPFIDILKVVFEAHGLSEKPAHYAKKAQTTVKGLLKKSPSALFSLNAFS